MTDEEPLPGQKPARGAIEIKPTKGDAWVTADSEQVTKYWKEYGQVLVTNYRDFVLVGRDSEGKPLKLASCRLAADEKSFWKLAAHPRKTAQEQGDRFLDFLKLALLSPAILAAPKDVAWVLAYYAREAKFRVEAKAELPALATVRAALEQALGLKFEGEKGEHFFRSSLVQTLFYGVFSAWVLWSKENPPISKAKFDWKLAQWKLRVPMIRALFVQVATPGQLGPLGLVEVLDWTAAVLNRVDRGAFFTQFQEQQAVQYFYEPFLDAFDPELRKDLGVWYTPLEVVKYMVARADMALREELGLEDGLADKNVYVLDPGCGTGAYLVEVLNTITSTLKNKGDDALAAHEVKRAAMERVFGFEILPAPFVISHLQLGVLLQNVGAPLAEDGTERVGVFLTNSLTGWEPPKGPKQHLIFPEMEAERDAAERVKREEPILVVIGNPPYNAFAGVSPAEEEGLVEPYKEGLISVWGIKKFNLDDLYVRFFRLAERRIAEKNPGRGIVCYISSFSYLRGVSFVVMRNRFLTEFDKIWIDCMNGDSRETGKLTPEGQPDPSVFSTDVNKAGIRVGTAIALLVRKSPHQFGAKVYFRGFWGTKKRFNLLKSLDDSPFGSEYVQPQPTHANFFSFHPGVVQAAYLKWPTVPDLSSTPLLQGLDEDRANALIEIGKSALETRLEAYLDPDVEWDEFAKVGGGLSRKSAGFNPAKTRAAAQKRESFDKANVVPYVFRPLDTRWCYYTTTPNVWKRSRPELGRQVRARNTFLITRAAGVAKPEGVPFFIVDSLIARDCLRGHAVAFPLQVDTGPLQNAKQATIPARADVPEAHTEANLSVGVHEYLNAIGLWPVDQTTAASVWMHVLAIGYSPLYLRENADAVRRDWPRIPLPSSKVELLKSAELGSTIAALLSRDAGLIGITSSVLRPELKVMGNVSIANGKPLDTAEDLKIDVGWGHAGKDAVTMPGKGKLVERDYSKKERDAINEGAAALGLTLEQALAAVGDKTCDVYLNDVVYWKNIPNNVWDYTIGGYQVIKKWLSYRDVKLLGRPITPEEAHYVRDMARRIAAICLLQPQLDANYSTAKNTAYVWPNTTNAAVTPEIIEPQPEHN